MLRYIIRRMLWCDRAAGDRQRGRLRDLLRLPHRRPGEAARRRAATAEQIEQIRESLGLDDPMLRAVPRYMAGSSRPTRTRTRASTVHFDFGNSFYQNNKPVREIIFDRLPATVFLVTGAVVIWLAIAIPVGIISAVKRRSLLDRATMITTLALHLRPGLLARARRPLPVRPGRRGSSRSSPGSAATTTPRRSAGKVGSLILPWLVLAAATAAIYARYLRSQLIDVMAEDYIRTARAKGLSERRVIWRHGVRSAITPIVTLLGLDVAVLLAGNAILTETVFNIPGVGKETVTAIDQSDLPADPGDRPLRRLLHRHLQPDRRHPLRLPRPAGALPVSLLEVQRPAGSTSRPTTAWSRPWTASRSRSSRARRSGSSASRAAARASPT